jgi:hypothetical protein
MRLILRDYFSIFEEYICMDLPDISYFWNLKGFVPNENQRAAILHKEGPLLLTAGPGSGKTRHNVQ